MKRIWWLVALALVAASCSTDTVGDETTDHGWDGCNAPSVATVPTLGVDPADWQGPELALQPVADIEKATSLVQISDGRLLVTAQTGQLWLVDGDQSEVLLDLEGVVSHGVEQGLIDVVQLNGLVLLSYTDRGDDLVVRSYQSDDLFNLGEFREVIKVKQPHEWHNSGAMEVGPDGYLYVAVGDGGNIADPGKNGQDTETLLGAILRIEPFHGGYEVPDGSFIGQELFSDDSEEIFVFGLRNPWRFSFDSETGDMWIGDVGQGCIEELDFVAAGTGGHNFGWSRLEGTSQFIGDVPEDHTLPVFEYAHATGGCAITGGYVYHGSEIVDLDGIYVFADYCRGRLYGISHENGVVLSVEVLGPKQRFLTSFGEGNDGELFVLTGEDGIFKLVASS